MLTYARHAAPPPGVDVHRGLPVLVPDSYSEFDVKWLPEGREDSSGSRLPTDALSACGAYVLEYVEYALK